MRVPANRRFSEELLITLQKKIGEIANENPAALEVFERLEIDYSRPQTFAEASREAGLTPAELFAMIADSDRYVPLTAR